VPAGERAVSRRRQADPFVPRFGGARQVEAQAVEVVFGAPDHERRAGDAGPGLGVERLDHAAQRVAPQRRIVVQEEEVVRCGQAGEGPLHGAVVGGSEAERVGEPQDVDPRLAVHPAGKRIVATVEQ
jgi:hypothetical protein